MNIVYALVPFFKTYEKNNIVIINTYLQDNDVMKILNSNKNINKNHFQVHEIDHHRFAI